MLTKKSENDFICAIAFQQQKYYGEKQCNLKRKGFTLPFFMSNRIKKNKE